MQHPDVTEQIYSSAAQQKIALLCNQGKGHEEAKHYDQQLYDIPSDYRLWLLCTAAHEFVEEYDKALEVVTKAIQPFPDNPNEKACCQNRQQAFSDYVKMIKASLNRT